MTARYNFKIADQRQVELLNEAYKVWEKKELLKGENPTISKYCRRAVFEYSTEVLGKKNSEEIIYKT